MRGSLWATLDEGVDVASALTRFGERVASISAQDWVVRANRTVLSVADRMPDLAKNFYESGRGSGERRFAEYLAARVADGSLIVKDTLLAAQQFFALCQAAFMRARLYGALATEPTPAEDPAGGRERGRHVLGSLRCPAKSVKTR